MPCRTVLIVDDHADFRAVATALLQRGDFRVVAEAGSLAEAFRAILAVHPDVVLLDVHLPDGDGIDAAAVIAASADAPAVVLVSARRPRDLGSRLAEAHASGFLVKDQLSARHVEALL